jgi:hypothetical protein
MTLGLFEKRIEGDNALMELARLRFQQARMGAEMHASTPLQLEELMRFRPSFVNHRRQKHYGGQESTTEGGPANDLPVVVHLPRHFHLLNEEHRKQITAMASAFAGRSYGMVIHDHSDLISRADDFVNAAKAIESRLADIRACPLLFVEYAAGLEPRMFARFFESIRDLAHVSACIDVGHVGIKQARNTFANMHLGEDICALKNQPSRIPDMISDVETAVGSALPTVLDLMEALGKIGKPVHFHLHDGHPLSTFSPFGVSDHLSFLMEMPLGFEYRGRRSVPLMFGRAGLQQIAKKAIQTIGFDRVSFTLEIHPLAGQLSLGDVAPFFNHWIDKTNAERMNHWLAVLSENHRALLEGLKVKA